MTTSQLFGTALICAGIFDCVLAVAVIGPRAPDGARRRIVVGARVAGGVVMALLGAAFLLGVFPALGED